MRKTKSQLISENEGLRKSISELKSIQENSELLERALLESEYRYRNLYENAPLGYMSLDERGNFIEVNEAWCRLLGYDKEKVVGLDFIGYLTNESQRKFIQRFPEIQEKDERFNLEYEMLKKDGSHLIISFEGSVARSIDGEFKQAHFILHDITERRKSEDALRESEEKYRFLVESLEEGIGIVDGNESFTFVNQAVTKIFGYSKKELLEKNLKDFTTPEEFQRILEETSIRKTGESSEYDVKIKRKDGVQRIISMNASPIIENKTYKGAFGIFHDITEHKQAEEALRLLSKAVESSIDGLAMADLESRITYVNKAFISMFGYSREELIGKEISVLYPEDQLPKLGRGIKAAMEGSWEGELVARKKDGDLFPIAISTSRVVDEQGNVITYMASHRDITERKQAEQEIRKLSRAVIQSPALIVITDTKGNIEYVNPRFTQITGYTFEEVKGKNPRILKSGETQDEEYKELWETITAGGEWSGEFHNKKKNGELYWEFATISPVLDEEGKISSFLAVKEDITERKQAEKALQESEAQKQAILDGITTNIAFVNENLEMLWVNKTAADSVGKSPEEIIGYKCYEFWADPEKPCENCPTLKAFKTKKSEHTIMFTPNGRIWEESGMPVFDENGKLIGVVEIAQDITEKKRLEEAQSVLYKITNAINTSKDPKELFVSIRKFLSKIIDITNFYVALYDEETDTISLPFIVDEKDKFTSFPAGKTLTAYVIKTGKALLATEDVLERLVHSGEVELIGEPSKIWLGVPLKLEGKVMGIIAVQSYTDPNLYTEKDVKVLEFVSDAIALAVERKRAEEEIRTKNRFLEELIYQSPFSTFVLDSKGVVVMANQAFLELYFVPDKELVLGRNALTEPANIRQGVVKYFKEALSGKIVDVPKKEFVSPYDNKRMVIRVKLFPIFDENGEVTYIVVMQEDITEGKQAEEVLKHRLLVLSQPSGETEHLKLTDIIDVDILQRLQDSFAESYDVAALIYDEKGNPVTKPSNFSDFCSLIRSTEKGMQSCKMSKANISKRISTGFPVAVTCKVFEEVFEGATPIFMEGRYVGTWGIGQKLSKKIPEDRLRNFAREIGISEDEFVEAANKLKTGTREQFEKAVSFLNVIAEDVSLLGLQNIQQARAINERKHAEEEIKASKEQLRNLSSHLQSVREEERTNMAHDIHDVMGSALTALKMDVSLIEKGLTDEQFKEHERINSIKDLISETVKNVQKIAAELRPGILDDFGLTMAIEWQANEFEKRSGMKCEINIDAEEINFDEKLSTAVFRIFQESLTNVARHSKADKVKVDFILKKDELKLAIIDNGIGIKDEEIKDSKSIGLLGMQERVYPWKGSVDISGIPGKGTSVKVSIPLR